VKRTDDVVLKDLIDDILTLIKYDKNLSENVSYELNLSDVKVKCDKAKLQQALLNIITNALQAMKGQPNPKLICHVKSEGYFASLEFTDNGPGMPEDVAQRIFEPFYTTKSKGTGLGLAITHRIIEGHEGLIKVTSTEKKGTTFFIRLPIK
jgi:C4-dicarboxylate-specific signal transduction histidine kinase